MCIPFDDDKGWMLRARDNSLLIFASTATVRAKSATNYEIAVRAILIAFVRMSAGLFFPYVPSKPTDVTISFDFRRFFGRFRRNYYYQLQYLVVLEIVFLLYGKRLPPPLCGRVLS